MAHNPGGNDISIPVTERRSLSCHGVSFETNQQLPTQHLPVVAPSGEGVGGGENNGRWVWIPFPSLIRGSSYRIFPSSIEAMERSVSRASSHYCDLNENDNDDHDHGGDLEGQKEAVDDEEQKKMKNPEEKPNPQPVNTNSKPPSLESRLSVILLDQGLFTVYKRLFTLCLTLNVIALVLAVTGSFPYAQQRPALFSLGNILALSLCRSEAFLRIIFWLAVKVLGRRWVPLPVKTATTSLLQSLGGIHSSCGISSIAWLIYGLVQTLQQTSPPEIIAVTSTILSLLCVSCMAAFPLVRHLHHNLFERAHRFGGWTALALLWVFVTIKVGYNPNTKSYDNLTGSRLAKQQEFWFTLAITILIILPWITIRRVPVSVFSPSGHASIIKFPGGVKAGILGRISRSPLSEWHAFGIISDGKDSHMMLAGAVGDFTKGLVSDPPTHLWVRAVHFAGLPYLVNMYERAVLVATGSGICVFLSFLLQPCAADVCVVWVTKGVEQNFGKEIKEMMSGHPEKKVIIHDTAVSGRPNVAKITIDAAKSWKADVVVVTSNPQGSRDVVTACKAAGIPAFGPIWDS